jgi:hypothetical protein
MFRNRLIANHVATDDDTIINRRLDLFIHEFEVLNLNLSSSVPPELVIIGKNGSCN